MLVINFKECVKLGTSVERHNANVTKGHFSDVLWMSLNKFLTNFEAISMFPSICLPNYLYAYLQSI